MTWSHSQDNTGAATLVKHDTQTIVRFCIVKGDSEALRGALRFHLTDLIDLNLQLVKNPNLLAFNYECMRVHRIFTRWHKIIHV